MKYKQSFGLLMMLVHFSGCLRAQQWSGIIHPSRAVNWAKAGVLGKTPYRTSICATLNPRAGTTQINSAIASCPANQAVYLNAGTYLISGGITFARRNDVTLRGAGPDKTVLIFTGPDTCGGLYADICIPNNQLNYNDGPLNTAEWTTGYSKGSVVITLSNTESLRIGALLILDQENDLSDTGGIWICGTGAAPHTCCVTCWAGTGRKGPPARDQMQVVRVTAIHGNQVTLEDPLYMPNWRRSQKPGAWWSSATAVTGVGIEDLSVDHSKSPGYTGISFYNAYGCWIKNIKSLYGSRNHVDLYQSAHITVRDSYFYGTKRAETESYGIEHYEASSNLIENNIFHHLTNPMLSANGQGSVFGYNYSIDDHYRGSTDWLMASSYIHGPGTSYLLWEGNDGTGLRADYFHGLSDFVTAFRNRWSGWEPSKAYQTIPIYIQKGHRFFNTIGNVLGKAHYHVEYSSDMPAGSANCNRSIFSLGWGGLCQSGPLPDDPLVIRTLMRWGNYDTVNGDTRWQASEVPSSIGQYANSLPKTRYLPPSFYLSSQPPWWNTEWGAPPWPAIGPDVINGGGPGGHSYSLPAQLCYDNSVKDSNGILRFDANNCYRQSSAAPGQPGFNQK